MRAIRFRCSVLGWLVLGVAARAQLACPAPSHHAGTARTGTKLVHEFALANAGTSPLEITGVKTGCGCLTAAARKKALGPGERTTLLLEAATATQAEGKNAWRATVRYRQDGRDQELHATLTADLVADVTVTPATMVLHAGARSHPFTLLERRETPMKLLSVGCDSPHVEAVAGEPRRVDGRWMRTVSVRVLP
ncbi:MAG: DUF1573 domain-containing protein, partial [Gemmataceae bacterium]|nr:DUF1573 domain-containing protein [Gemmataceae bacterium]